MKIKDSFHPYAMITILFWSLAYVLTRLCLQHFSSFSLGFLRYFIASLTLIVIAAATKMKPPRKKDLPLFILSGGMGFFFYMIAFNQGLASVTAATASVVIATVPVLTSLFARVLYQEKLKVFQWVAIPVEFAGVVVLTVMDSTITVNYGLIWLFLAALALAIYNLLQRKLTKTYTALQASTFSIFCGTALLTVFAPTSIREASHAPAIQFLYLALLGVCCGAVAYVTWSKAFSKAKKTSQVSNYMFVTPFLTSILGFLLAHEYPGKATFAGGGIILLGVFIYNFGGKLMKNNSLHLQ